MEVPGVQPCASGNNICFLVCVWRKLLNAGCERDVEFEHLLVKYYYERTTALRSAVRSTNTTVTSTNTAVASTISHGHARDQDGCVGPGTEQRQAMRYECYEGLALRWRCIGVLWVMCCTTLAN